MTAPHPAPAENPYLAARREWNERYGDYLAAARNWRYVALASLALAACACVALGWIGVQNRIVPYVVEVNRLGEPVGVTRADAALAVDPRVLKAQLARAVTCLRSVTADVAVQRRMVFELYAMLSNGDPATVAISAELKARSPFERAATEAVSIDLNSILPISGETWQIDWTEARRDRRGQILQVARWRASATVAFQPPKSEQELLKNPIGLFIREFAWSQQLASK